MSIGFDPAGLTSNAQVIADENTYPTNVTFTFANDRSNGAILGQNIPPGKTKPFWFRLTSRFGAQEMLTNALVVRLLADNLVTQVIDQAPVPSSTASFTLTGETDLNNSLNSIVDEIQYRNANLNISTGNNTGNPTSQNPEDYFSVLGDALSRVTRTALGANDMKSTSQINQYLNRYGNADKYHSFTYQDIHFLFMDTASGPAAYATSSPQYEFVVNDLKSAAADPAIDWIFVIMNRAMYASQTTTRTLYVLKSLRDIYHPLFEQYGVHVVVNGYFRNYQRQHILRFNGADSDNPTTILSGSAPNYLITKGNATFDDGSGNTGCLFINAGMGGTSHDSIPSPSSFTAANNTANFGYLFFLMNNVKTYAIPGDLTSGLLEDYHEIICSFYDESQDILRDQFSIRKIVGQNVQQSSRHRYDVAQAS